MADISIPGIKGRFDTDKMIEGLMEVERIPRKRAESSLETLKSQKSTWQALGLRITALRDGASGLYSYQNPFNERAAKSSNEDVLGVTVTREARGQNVDFTVKQIAQADKYISQSVEKDYKVPAGNYTFGVGNNEISFKFGGGSLREFSDALNRRADGKFNSSVVAVKAGTASLMLSSQLTGTENRLRFADDAVQLVSSLGMAETKPGEPLLVHIKAAAKNAASSAPEAVLQTAAGDSLKVAAMSETSIDLNGGIKLTPSMVLKFETSVTPSGVLAGVPGASGEAAPENLNAIKLRFSDGTAVDLPAVENSSEWSPVTYKPSSAGKTATSLEIRNQNTRNEISIRSIQAADPLPQPVVEPVNAISTAQDALVVMDGIEIERPSNKIDDLIPGMTLNLHAVSDAAVNVQVERDNEAVKNAVISLVGSYNRLMAELNVLTRNDEKILSEITYLKDDEREELKSRLGMLSGDTSVQKLRNDLISIVNAPYNTVRGDTVMLAEFGVTTDARRSGTGGYDPSRLRGYLEIDEKALDDAIANKFDSLRELMGKDSDGDLIVDSGLAFSMTRLVRPFTEVGGVIAGKTGNLDTRIAADNRTINAIDRRLERKEGDLKRQYGKMEDAYNRMERMSNSLNNWSAQGGGKQ